MSDELKLDLDDASELELGDLDGEVAQLTDDSDDGGLELDMSSDIEIDLSDDVGSELSESEVDSDDGGLDLGNLDELSMELGGPDLTADEVLEEPNQEDAGLDDLSLDDLGLDLAGSELDDSELDDSEPDDSEPDEISAAEEDDLSNQSVSDEDNQASELIEDSFEEELSDLSFNATEMPEELTEELPEELSEDISLQAADDLSMGDLETGNTGIDDFEAKLAEIDAMMGEVVIAPVKAVASMDATGDVDAGLLDELNQADETNMEFNEASYKNPNRTSTHVRSQMDDIESMLADNAVDLKAQSKMDVTEVDLKVPRASMNTKEVSQDIINMHSTELARLSATINNLREDRERLLEKISQLESDRDFERRDSLSVKAELDEKKIELALIKKRFNQQVEEISYKLNLSEEKRRLLEEKNKKFQSEYERLGHKVKVDLNKIQAREKELEHQLELLKADAEVQIKNRDQKILELKRKIDTLEFDIDQLSNREKTNRNDKIEVEEKMEKLMKTLRSAISSLEEDDGERKDFDFIKKNLDM
jgi:hypothetical protein